MGICGRIYVITRCNGLKIVYTLYNYVYFLQRSSEFLCIFAVAPRTGSVD